MSYTKEVVIIICLVFVIIFVIIGVIHILTPPPTINKNKETIQHIEIKTDSIITKVNQLDSIKNAKVIEIQTISNDSVVKLFYELVSE